MSIRETRREWSSEERRRAAAWTALLPPALILSAAACVSERAAPRIFFSIEVGPDAHATRIVTADGGEAWAVEGLEHVYAARPTPAGTVLATLCEDDGRPLGLAEVDRDGRILWRYAWPAGRAGIDYLRASHALKDGHVVVAGVRELGDDGRYAGAVILEMDRAGNEVRSVELGPTRYLGAIRPRPGGVLVAGEGVFELDWDGTTRTIVPPSGDTLIYDALPLPDGHCVIGETAQRLVEIAPDGREVWATWHVKPVFLQRLSADRLLVGG